MPDGGPLPETAILAGRGPDLHVVSGHQWLRLDLTDLNRA